MTPTHQTHRECPYPPEIRDPTWTGRHSTPAPTGSRRTDPANAKPSSCCRLKACTRRRHTRRPRSTSDNRADPRRIGTNVEHRPTRAHLRIPPSKPIRASSSCQPQAGGPTQPTRNLGSLLPLEDLHRHRNTRHPRSVSSDRVPRPRPRVARPSAGGVRCRRRWSRRPRRGRRWSPSRSRSSGRRRSRWAPGA